MTITLDYPKTTLTDKDRQMSDLLELVPYGADVADLGGYGTEGDIVYTTADGMDLNALWAEIQATLAVWNAGRSKLVSLLTFPVVNEVETVPQVGEATFEEASEFGEPQGERLQLGYFQLGYDFKDYDRATRFTWKALRDMDARQIQAVNNALLQADERLVFRKTMEAIFDNVARTADIRGQNYNVYPLYNADGTVPPDFQGNTFDGTHTHYLASGQALIDSSDLEAAYNHLEHHGYGVDQGTTVVHMFNRAQVAEVRKFRTGVANNNGQTALYDFIPSAAQPPQFLDSPLGLLGTLPPSEWQGLRVVGSYGDALLIENSFIPSTHFFTFGTGGASNLQNLVGFREHKNPVYRGLRVIPGNDQRYPLAESYYSRAFGTGIRQRGGAVVTYLHAAPYAAPSQYTRTPNALLA